MMKLEGARERSLGGNVDPRLNVAKNTNKAPENKGLRNQINTVLSQVKFDPIQTAQDFINLGRRLG